jgi:TrmH family RNA methyltransferase
MLSKNEVKYIRSLRLKKGRTDSGCFQAEGPRLVHHLLQYHTEDLQQLYVTEAYQFPDGLVVDEKKLSVISSRELETITSLQQPQEIFAIFKQAQQQDLQSVSTGWLLALDGIRDPGNMGSVFRLADWFGFNGIVCSEDCADQYNPKVVQASMGSVLRLPVQVTSLKKFFEQSQLPAIGAVLNGEVLRKESLPESGILVIGNEGEGIRSDLLPLIDYKITIPSYGTAESLNAAMATGIIMWELRR